MGDDKDKSVIEKLVDKINDTVENIVTTASDALNHAMEPEPLEPGDKVLFVPMAGDGVDPMMPQVPAVIPTKKRKASKKPKPTPKKAATKKTAKKSAKKSVKKAVKKAAKKAVKTKSKKSKR